MPEKHAWMVRAGDYNELIGDFWDKSMVAMGPARIGDISKLQGRDEFKKKYREAYPELSENSINVNAGQIFRFTREIQIGDYILSFDKSSRTYPVGEVAGEARFDLNAIDEKYPHIRQVKWIKKLQRDLFTVAAKNALGSTLTVFRIDTHLEELERLIEGEASIPPNNGSDEEGIPFYDEVKEKADELISDAISRIDPYELQDLVAALLRAMGLRTAVSPPGPDMGVDVIAHPDAFGFQSPRIKVQVKHRTSPASGPDVRNFTATLRDGENGLFVSTGGFTKDGKFEAERAARPVTLFDRDAFVDLLIENYENLEPEYKALIPLKKVYIPVRV